MTGTWTRRCAFAVLALLIAGCSSLLLGIANVAARNEPVTRTPGIPYGTDGHQSLDVHVPKTTSAGGAPVMVFVHGGAWDAGSKEDYRFVGAALATRGYVAVVPGYRIYPKVRFPLFVEDAAQAVAWARTHAAEYGGDPRRLFLMGHSAGAHIVMLLALDEHYLQAAGMSSSDLRGVIGLSGPYDFYPFSSGFQHAVFDFGGDPLLTQPIHFVRGNAPPILLLYGSADKVVDPQNSARLADALRSAGSPVTIKVYPNVSHGDTVAAFSKLKSHRPPVIEDIDAFVIAVTR